MNSFFLLFIGLPALEIFLLIKIGGEIGAFNTVSLIFLTAIVGIYFAKLEGIKTLRSGVANLYVAFNYDEATWVNFKLFGLLGLTILFIIGQSLYLGRHIIEPIESNEDKV